MISSSLTIKITTHISIIVMVAITAPVGRRPGQLYYATHHRTPQRSPTRRHAIQRQQQLPQHTHTHTNNK